MWRIDSWLHHNEYNGAIVFIVETNRVIAGPHSIFGKLDGLLK